MDGGGRERRLRVEMKSWPMWLARRFRAASGRSQLQCIQQDNNVQRTPAKGQSGRLVQFTGTSVFNLRLDAFAVAKLLLRLAVVLVAHQKTSSRSLESCNRGSGPHQIRRA